MMNRREMLKGLSAVAAMSAVRVPDLFAAAKVDATTRLRESASVAAQARRGGSHVLDAERFRHASASILAPCNSPRCSSSRY